MKAAKPMLAALVLLFAMTAATAVWARSENSSRKAAEEGVETGGWQVAYSDELTEQEAVQGLVAPGVSLYAERGGRDMDAVHDWADSLVRQAVALLPRRTARELDRKEQFQARRFTIRTIRGLLRSQLAGEELKDLDTLELKAGLMEYRDRSRRRDRDRDDHWQGRRRSEQLFVPYVGIRAKNDHPRRSRDRDSRDDHRWNKDERRGSRGDQDDRWQQSPEAPVTPQQVPPSQEQFKKASSAEVFNALSLTNTARQLDRKRWEWTAYIDGPPAFLRRISSVIYYLHPSFKPAVQQGDNSKLGHPLTAIGWGVFQLKAEVTLDDGHKQLYEHTLQF
ncbi:YEATS family protein [Candidatus Electronema halotolerans]